MNKRADYQLQWSGFHGCESQCRVQLFDDLIFKGRTIAILTEIADNPGTSVTNDIETIARTLFAGMFGIDIVRGRVANERLNPTNTTFIEHYPERFFNDGRKAFPETFDVVTFGGVKNDMFRRPEWFRIEWETLRPFISETEGVSWSNL